jgi:hypothetical protein
VAGAKVETLFSKAAGWALMHSERYPEHEALVKQYEPAKQYLKNPLTAGSKWDWKVKDITLTDLEEEPGRRSRGCNGSRGQVSGDESCDQDHRRGGS